MKRSEIILNIANYLCKEEYGEETAETMRSSIESRLFRQADEILSRLEGVGMLPPLNEHWMSLDECKEFYGPSWENDVSTYPRKNVHRWEPEE